MKHIEKFNESNNNDINKMWEIIDNLSNTSPNEREKLTRIEVGGVKVNMTNELIELKKLIDITLYQNAFKLKKTENKINEIFSTYSNDELLDMIEELDRRLTRIERLNNIK